MNEAFKLGLSDLSILADITFLNITRLRYKAARESLEYEMQVQAGPKMQKRMATLYSQCTQIVRQHVQLEA